MSATQDKPSAPVYNGDLPPPYSAVVGGAPGEAPAYPQMGFVTQTHTGANVGPPLAHTAPPNAYPHPGGYPHPVQEGVYMQQPGLTVPVPVSVLVAPPVGPEPMSVYCATCQKQVTTRVDYCISWHTHIIAGIVCFSSMFFSMCCLGLVPYCLDSCKNAEHHCPSCNAFIGKYERC